MRVILDGQAVDAAAARCAAGRAGRLHRASAARRARSRLARAAPRSCGCRASAGASSSRALLDELGRRERAVAARRRRRRRCTARFLAAGLADEVALFVAPKLIGAGGVPLIAVDGPTQDGRGVAPRRGFDASARR